MSVRAKQGGQLGQVAMFGAVSVTTTLLDFGLFNLLVLSDAAPVVIANTLSYGAGIVASYVLNKRLTFAGGGRDRRSQEIALFVVVNVAGLVLNNAAVAVAAWTAGSALVLNLAKIGAGAVTWVLKFAAFQRWVYPRRSSDGVPTA